MASAPSPARDTAPGLSDAQRAPLDTAVAELATGTRVWARLTLAQRRKMLQRIRAAVVSVAEEWADVAATSKDLEPGHPLRGEEWLSGPYAALVALDAYIETLGALLRGASPLDGLKVDEAPGGRVRVHVLPTSGIDALLLSGYTGEVWLQPGVSAGEAARTAGLGQLPGAPEGGVGLVLGAGNVTAIPFLDVLYELLAFNRVTLLKVNPTQDDLVPVYERALAPLIGAGLLRIVRGGGDVGAYLTTHPGIEHVHITGSVNTFDAIVWGTGDDAVSRREADDPKLTVPITAELGGVSPIIVVPGEWSDADLRFQAEHIVTMRLYNSGHNCIAGQIVLMSSDWPQREAFLAALRAAYDAAPARSVWYPNAQARIDAASALPGAERCGDGTRVLIRADAADATAMQTTEYFAPVLGVVELAGTGQDFVDAAVAHANAELTGTLGANVIIDPATQAQLGDGFEEAMAQLHYGTVAINAWTALGFLTPTCSWGAYPGGTLGDAPSGIGIVHNARLLDRVERSVVRGPFRPFPRSIGAGQRFSVLPKPPWFVSARTGAAVSEGLTRFRMDGSLLRLMATLTRAFGA
ncbi:aldehyde dehydrogenase family protein [Microbacterium wangruii]|uniref:aldehyde dehydrogenase family protein n=1 Tax=Microbacterium wangruii TaxID=3049073 RepID=UPI00256F05DB|nr:aldehyde dehydrogenase family protein [Microbacterium sp. zg-Y1211]MDL5487109.1 aldehyde dehydrogenase family protein [Microbacterium sp. zg-Y1211]